MLLTKYCLADNIKKNKTGGACRPHREEERCIKYFGGETSREINNLENLGNLGIEGKIILKQVIKKWDEA